MPINRFRPTVGPDKEPHPAIPMFPAQSPPKPPPKPGTLLTWEEFESRVDSRNYTRKNTEPETELHRSVIGLGEVVVFAWVLGVWFPTHVSVGIAAIIFICIMLLISNTKYGTITYPLLRPLLRIPKRSKQISHRIRSIEETLTLTRQYRAHVDYYLETSLAIVKWEIDSTERILGKLDAHSNPELSKIKAYLAAQRKKLRAAEHQISRGIADIGYLNKVREVEAVYLAYQAIKQAETNDELLKELESMLPNISHQASLDVEAKGLELRRVSSAVLDVKDIALIGEKI